MASSMSDDDVVISGMSGRFPMSDNVEEFAKNLYDGIDMVTADDSRWPMELNGICPRMAKIQNTEDFDVLFFGIMQQMADEIDPQSRLLLEATYESILDAGINPQTLRGSKTGVYIGLSSYGKTDGYPEELQPDSRASKRKVLLQTMGNAKAMYANRISYILDFKGPSMIVDTACSASLVAFNLAMNDLKLGYIDYAIVGGAHMTFEHFICQMSQEVGVCSPRGVSAVLDESADGFVKGEAVATVLLQKRWSAKRVYSTVLASRVNIDGKKTVGMFYPSSESQEQLMVMAYNDAKIDPLKLTYFEAHCTGTKVGDPQEVKAIYNAYCDRPNRKERLPLGLLKSNVGHTEAASGVAALIKVLISYENECIPMNINLNKIKYECAQYCPPLYPNTENLKYEPGMAAVNNFGIGGVNGHIIIEPNYKLADKDCLKIAETMPRIVNICGRTEESIQYMFNFIEKNPKKITQDFLALLSDTMKVAPSINSAGMPYRGSMLIKKLSEKQNEIEYSYKKQFSVLNSKTLRPVWFLFPGLGGQWSAMAKALMPIKVFADKLEECHQILKEFGIDLRHLLLSDDKNAMSSMTSKFCATTALQICLFEIMKELDITPDGIIGHSFGEIACAYADGCITAKEALVVTYMRGRYTENNKDIPKGLMAVVGLSKNEAKRLVPPGIYVVCNNAKKSVVLSGPKEEMKKLIETLNSKEVFVRELDSSDIPYHSDYLKPSSDKMTNEIKKYLREPKLRSRKWISTAILEVEPEDSLKYASAEYFVYNLLNPVQFYDRVKEMPSDAIVIELSPHSVFGKIIGETLDTASYMALLKKDGNDTNLDNFLQSVAKLYELGLNPAIENLYDKVQWPVARNTQSIGSLMKWDHNIKLLTRKYPEVKCRATASDMNVVIDICDKEQSFYADHAVDGNNIFPATGYLLLAWKQFAATQGKVWYDLPVIFENVQFTRAVFLSDTTPTKVVVKYFENSGEFVILEKGNASATGKIRAPTEDILLVQTSIHEKQNKVLENEISLETEDLYKELRIMGYDYGKEFRRLKKIRTNSFDQLMGTIEWNGNIITFLDSMIQSMAFVAPFRKMMVPVMIKSLRIDPKVFFDEVKSRRIIEEKEFEEFNDIREYEEKTNQKYSEFMEMTHKALEYEADRFYLYRSDVPFYFDSNSKLLVTHGIELMNVMAFPIPRKVDTRLTLDSYQFIPNEDMNAIDVCEQKQINEYLEICESLSTQVIQLKFKDNKRNYMHNNENAVKEFKNSAKENHVLFKIFNKILTQTIDENQNRDMSDEKLNPIISSMKESPEYDLSKDLINQIQRNERLVRAAVDIVSENLVPRKRIKVFEINLNNNVVIKEVDRAMSGFHVYPIEVEAKLAVKSKSAISEDFRDNAMEWNPKESPLPSNMAPSDLIILRDTEDLWQLNTETLLKGLCEQIVDKGFVLSIFRYKFTEPEVALNRLLGANTVNNLVLEKRIYDFIKTAESVGFNVVCRKFDTIGTMSVLFRKIAEKGLNVDNKQIVNITNKYEDWFELLKTKLEFAKDMENKTDNIWLVANESKVNGILGFTNCLRLEPGGETIRCVFDLDSRAKHPIDFKSKPFSDILNNDLVINVVKDGNLGTYRHLKLSKDYDKIVTDDYFLNITHCKDLSTLQWFDLRKVVPAKSGVYNMSNHKLSQTKVQIYSTGLTFHDVMLATGRIPSGPQLLFTDCLIGCEFAGRRADTGERVMGFEMSRAFATSIDANENLLSPIPEHWSMDDAVTILSTYSTAWYALIERANLKKGESILIHSAAGGVGQSAINICKHYECDIFVTVGTEEKRKFLMTEYGIPENRIFSSRDIQFKYRIMELTKGRGVDLVLNSLAGEKLDAGYECVADNGRFLELGKFDLVQNKQLGMFDFIRDVCFIGVAVDVCLVKGTSFGPDFFDWMHKNSRNGCVKPFNRTIFKAEEAEKAFRYMTTGKHIGKIVIRMREEETDKRPLKAIKPAALMVSTAKTYFNPNKVYIITGGLGGFGLELLHWMLYMGAKKFVLTSRYGVRTNYQKFILKRLENFGEKCKIFNSKVFVSTADCFTTDGTKQLFREAEEMGPIGGVFHLALVLKDCLLENQTFEIFTDSVYTKHKTFNNLDQLSRGLGYELDYFVVFSSIACGVGNAGQSNYSFGNALCERICEQRRSDGLHGLAIQFGPIGDVGVWADLDQGIQFSSLDKQRINSCCDILDKILTAKEAIITSFIKVERAANEGSREKRMVKQLWRALGIDPENTPEHLTLGEIGMESMFAVELQQELEREWNIKMSLNNIKNITVKMLKDYEAGRIDDLKCYVDDVKKARATLLRYKFLIPPEPYTALNNVTTGKPVYFMPPVETTFSAFIELAEKINRPVIGLNWTRDLDGFTTMKEVSKYYMNLMDKLSPNGQYDIVGYFDGALIAQTLLRKKRVSKAVIIDVLSDERFRENTVEDDFILEFIIRFLSQDIPNPVRDRLLREIKAEPDTNSKVRRAANEVKEFVGKGLIATDIEQIFTNIIKRTRFLTTYRSEKRRKITKLKLNIGKKWTKMTGKLVIIKPFKWDKVVEDLDEALEATRDVYFLPNKNESNDSITIESVDEIPYGYTSGLIEEKLIESLKL